jgi:hypothetical protein
VDPRAYILKKFRPYAGAPELCHTSIRMKPSVIVWDLETVPDLAGFAAANDLVGKSDVEVREAIGDKFPKHIYHSIVCTGARSSSFVMQNEALLKKSVNAHRDSSYGFIKSTQPPSSSVHQISVARRPRKSA